MKCIIIICSGEPLNLTCDKAPKERANDEAVMTDAQPCKSQEGGRERDWPLPDRRIIVPGFSHQKSNCSHHPLYQMSFCPWVLVTSLLLLDFSFVGYAFCENFHFFSMSLLSIWAYFYSSISGESPCLQHFLSCCFSVILITKGDHPLSS